MQADYSASEASMELLFASHTSSGAENRVNMTCMVTRVLEIAVTSALTGMAALAAYLP